MREQNEQKKGRKRSSPKSKRLLNVNVYTAASQRLSEVFDCFPNFYVSFSGGKDSGVLLNLVIQEAEKRNRLPVDVLIVDFEAQYKETECFIKRMVETGKINPYWVCLPISLRNAVSQFQPKWICWDPENASKWVRPLPTCTGVISDVDFFPFFYLGMEFEDFVFHFSQWYQQKKGTLVSILIGIRSDESLNRFYTIKNTKKNKFKHFNWTTKYQEDVYLCYPIYDWKAKDIWVANGRKDWDYNKIYDLMSMAGVSLAQQRLCQPFGDEQRKGLWLYQILDHETWLKLLARVEGCHFGGRYSKKQSHVFGYHQLVIPSGWTYRQYSRHLLRTMPPQLESHYRQRIFQFLQWWRKNGPKRGVRSIPDFAPTALEAKKKVPSWRRICKVLVKNDYWCRGLSFGYNKRLGKESQSNHNQLT